MAASPEKIDSPNLRAIEEQLKVLDALEIIHNKAMLSYAGRSPRGTARELNGMFLLALQHQRQQLDLLKKHQTELAGHEGELEKERARLKKLKYSSSLLDESVRQLDGRYDAEQTTLKTKHKEELRVLKEKQEKQKKGKSKSSPAPSEAELQCLSGFANELHAKMQNAEWIKGTITYFKHLLLQPEIFDVHIQEQLAPIVCLLNFLNSQAPDSQDLGAAALISVQQFEFIQNMTNKESKLNKGIKAELKRNVRELDKINIQLETKLNRLYDVCMQNYLSENRAEVVIQRYMFTLLCEEVRQKYPQEKDRVNNWIRQKTEERAILAPMVVPQIDAIGSEQGQGSEDRGGKEEEKERGVDDNDDDEFENSDSPLAGRRSPTPKIERHNIPTSPMPSINSEHRGEGSSFVPDPQSGPGAPAGSPSASQTINAYATVFKLTTEQKVQAGFEVGMGLVMLLGGFVLAASAFVTIIPSFGTSLPVAGIGCAIGTAGMGLLTLGLSKFGLFGQKAQECALSVDWRIDASSIVPYYMMK